MIASLFFFFFITSPVEPQLIALIAVSLLLSAFTRPIWANATLTEFSIPLLSASAPASATLTSYSVVK